MKAARSAVVRWSGMVAALALVFAAVPATGQDATTTSSNNASWWVGGGGGYLAGRSACSNCATEPPYGDGGAFLFQGGVRVRDRVHIGAEIYSTNRTMPAGTFRNTHFLAMFQFRPFARAGFFLKGGYGMAIVKGVAPGASGDEVIGRTWGMGVMYGAGWEFRASRRVSFAPLAATYITTVGDITAPGGTAQNVVINGWFAGAVLMIH